MAGQLTNSADDEGAIAQRLELARTDLGRSATQLQVGRYEEALASVEHAIGSGADTPTAHTLRALCLRGLQQPEEALLSYDRAIALQPDYVPAYINRGVVLRELQRPAEALASYDLALSSAPDSFEALSNRTAVLVDLRRFEEALLTSERAIALRANRPEVHVNRAAALAALMRYEQALACYEQAIGLRPDSADALCGRASVLQQRGRSADALLDIDSAIRLAPQLAGAHGIRAAALRDLKRIPEAFESFRTACLLQPHDVQTQFNLGCLYLLDGQFALGWPLYDLRRKLRETPAERRLSQPEWRGEEDLHGKVLFLYVDQGLGDTLLFARYARLAEARGARVILSVQNDLRRLLSGLSRTIRVLGEAETPTAFDLYSPLSCLPAVFGTTLQSIPTDVPYLFAEAESVALWRQRLGTHGFKIGICWQGSAVAEGRSFPLQALQRVSSLPQVRLISLQKFTGIEQLRTLPAGMVVENLGEDLDTFADTAAVMSNLDLIISCDTSVAHLAGALARPCWVALKYVSDWRWLLDRDDSPWYPTLRLFRQNNAGRWDEVFEQIHHALSARLG